MKLNSLKHVLVVETKGVSYLVFGNNFSVRTAQRHSGTFYSLAEYFTYNHDNWAFEFLNELKLLKFDWN